MKTIQVEKLTLNIGAGKDPVVLDKSVKLLKHVTGITPVKTITRKRIAQWGIRPGLSIGSKLTLRGKQALAILLKLIDAKEKVLKRSCFDKNGSVSFSILEYIDIPGVEYNHEVGIMGLQVSVTLKRPGFRIKHRRLSSSIGKKHKISSEEAIEFFKSNYGIKLEEEVEREEY